MAYEKQGFADGNPLFASQLEAMEQGIIDAENGIPAAVNTALEQAKESGEFNGNPGSDGKSAYAYAQEGGYTGTEAAFSTKLAQEPLFGTTDQITPSEVKGAIVINRPVGITYINSPFGAFHFTSFDANVSLDLVFASSILQYSGMYAVVELIGDVSSDTWQLVIQQIPIMSDVPTDDHINALIDEKLGAITNAEEVAF